jgi:glycosyltransferase involved in cell wall biosynthesis
MHITICVCTRDRSASIAAMLRSLLASTYSDYDVVIVDQSAENTTEQCVRAIAGDDARFRYFRSATTGVCRARNLAIRQAIGPVIAFTDDDCEVAPDWLSAIASLFIRHPQVDMLCGAVHAAAFDANAGFIPVFEPRVEQRIASRWLKWREKGISANMAMRKALLERTGYFDPLLGPGAIFRAGDDWDFTYRALAASGAVLVTPQPSVTHHGFRDRAQGKVLVRGYSMGSGAAFMKHLRLGDLAVLPTLLIVWFRCIRWWRLITLRRENGVGNFLAYARGMMASFRYRVDRHAKVYRDPSTAGSAVGISPTENAANLQT